MDKIDFEALSKDADFMNRMEQFDAATDKIEDVLKHLENPDLYENLSNAEKIDYHLLLSFTLNSLFWMYLRAEGLDPTNNQIKSENERLQQSMIRAKQIKDRNLMPRLDKGAAKRFVKSSLWEAKKKTNFDDAAEEEPMEGDITEENWESGA